jgi:hypothetical protein
MILRSYKKPRESFKFITRFKNMEPTTKVLLFIILNYIGWPLFAFICSRLSAKKTVKEKEVVE